MFRTFTAALAALLLLTSTAMAQDKVIKSAMSAGPESISADATILDWAPTNGRACRTGRTPRALTRGVSPDRG
jgi:hypothetical protein